VAATEAAGNDDSDKQCPKTQNPHSGPLILSWSSDGVEGP
jgi:hypothetical protein